MSHPIKALFFLVCSVVSVLGVDDFEEDAFFGDDGFFGDDASVSVSGREPEKWSDRVELSGFVAWEQRAFFESPQFDEQLEPWQASLVFEPELTYESIDARHRFELVPFFRLDAEDDERSHVDLREFSWRIVEDEWDLLLGVSKVFWGVTESRHLVDIINQTDSVEDIDEEDKLGQLMINLNWVQEWGTLSAFVLPYFRERTFPGEEGRLRFPLVVDTDKAEYESSLEEWYPDFALRYQHTLGDWDIGASIFRGTSREPVFELNSDGQELIPRYELITQLGVDFQYTKDAWLLKFEGIGREGHGETFLASVAGVEYTFFQLFDTAADLGVLAEYLWDDRSAGAPPTIVDDDLFIGGRFALNDVQDTNLLAGVTFGFEEESALFVVEAERRLGDNWKLEIEARVFAGELRDSAFAAFADDSFLNFRVARYF